MLAVSGNFIVELPRKLINICLVFHLECQYWKDTEHRQIFLKWDIYVSNKILQTAAAVKGLSGEIMFCRGWAGDLSFTLGSIGWTRMTTLRKTRSTLLPFPPPLRAQPFVRCSLAENVAVSDQTGTASSSQAARRYCTERSWLCLLCEAETLTGALTYKYSPIHRYKNILLEFFKTCCVPVGQN